MRIIRFLNEFLCIIGSEEFSTTHVEKFAGTQGEIVDYTKLSNEDKNRILESYRKHQRTFMTANFC